jgi:hypothetical protein
VVDKGLLLAQGNEPSGVVPDEESDNILIDEAGPAIAAVDEVKLGIGQKRKHERAGVEKAIGLAQKKSRAHTQNKLGTVEGSRRSRRLHKT